MNEENVIKMLDLIEEIESSVREATEKESELKSLAQRILNDGGRVVFPSGFLDGRLKPLINSVGHLYDGLLYSVLYKIQNHLGE